MSRSVPPPIAVTTPMITSDSASMPRPETASTPVIAKIAVAIMNRGSENIGVLLSRRAAE